MEGKRINEFMFNDRITGFFSVRKKTIRESSRGQFVTLEIGDCSGRIAAVIWSPDQFSLTELTAGIVVKVRGVVGEYNDKLQLVVNRIRLATDDEYSSEDILPHSSQSLEQRKNRIIALTDRIENGYIRTLTDSFFKEDQFFTDYLMAAAGKLWHHAYVGGLAEHSANVTELALDVVSLYDFLDRDLLIFGGLLHDAGKIASYSTDVVIDYTDEGRLLGHICLVDDWICRRAGEIEAFPSSLLMKLRHVILAHHGALEYASPILPQIPEAFVLYYCDEIDSKMGAINRIHDKQSGTGWSQWVNLLNRFLYFDSKSEE